MPPLLRAAALAQHNPPTPCSAPHSLASSLARWRALSLSHTHSLCPGLLHGQFRAAPLQDLGLTFITGTLTGLLPTHGTPHLYSQDATVLSVTGTLV